MGKDNYLIPEHVLNTYSLKSEMKDKNYKTSKDKDDELLKSIEKLQVEDKDVLTVRSKGRLEDGATLIEIMNLSKCFDKIVEGRIEGEFNYKKREEMLRALGEALKEKNSVQIIIYASYNFEELKELVSKELNIRG